MTRTAAITAAVLLTATSAAAQGNSAGHGNAHQGGITAGAAADATPLPGSGTGSRTFGVWLDDASVAAPGGGWATFSMGYFRTDLFNEIDAPVADAGLGFTRRVQAGFTVPVYNVTPVGGSTSLQGVGDVYVHGKIQLRDPEWSLDGVGYAIVPIVEITREPVAGESKVNWAVPLAIEMRFARWRWYGSGGYFSRGSLFGSVAIERPLTSRLSLTGAFSDSFATKMLPNEPANLPRSRADITGGASYAMGPSWIVFGAIGRTISSHEGTSTNVAISGGVSLNLAAPKHIR